MAKAEDKVRAAVARLYKRKPTATLDEFIATATRADPSVAKLEKRSFNGRYVLPLKRQAAAAGRRKEKTTKRKLGRPRKKAAKKRRPGRPRKVAKRGPGRPRKKAAAKRGPGRPRKKTAVKRGPGRPRKKAAAKRGPGRPRKRPGITAAKFASIKRMILSRDRELLIAATNPLKAYEVAYDIDAFVEKLVKEIGSG